MPRLAARQLVALSLVASSALLALPASAAREVVLARAPVHSVVEIVFKGPPQTAADSPARDVTLEARFVHESGAPSYRVPGFFDGDGRGGAAGDVFKVRFTPTAPGRWTLAEVTSNAAPLQGQRQGGVVLASRSSHPGFWIVDEESPGRRWFRRSDGSHQYIVGNTFYGFLSETYVDGRPNGSNIVRDVEGNARYVKKLRFSPIGDLYSHPTDAPFLDADGRPTSSGDFSHRPNPAWFSRRVDRAVATAARRDLIADLIMSGVDLETSRSALRAAHNKGDATPFLRYLVARYAAYPNVWLCLINEYDIRTPSYTPEQIIAFGRTVKAMLAYPTPLTVHRNSGPWVEALNTNPPWNTLTNIQRKLKTMHAAADYLDENHKKGGGDKPIVDDELSYEGEGDKHLPEDTIESHVGAFLGGGYGTTGHKTAHIGKRRDGKIILPEVTPTIGGRPISLGEDGLAKGIKLGQYFAGNFDPKEHKSLDELQWFRAVVDKNMRFWKMAPDRSIFDNVDPESRGLAAAGEEYVLGTNKERAGIVARLPEGAWTVTVHDVIKKKSRVLARGAKGEFKFDAPASRAVLFHFKKAS
jgi:hypothetical protein